MYPQGLTYNEYGLINPEGIQLRVLCVVSVINFFFLFFIYIIKHTESRKIETYLNHLTFYLTLSIINLNLNLFIVNIRSLQS